MFILILFNELFSIVLKYINTSLHISPLARQTLLIKSFLFTTIKNEFFMQLLENTRFNNHQPERMYFNRFVSAECLRREIIDYHGKYSLFGQFMTSYNSNTLNGINKFRIAPGRQIFKTHFRGGGAEDAGGPCRETFENFVREIHNPNLLPLLPIIWKLIGGHEIYLNDLECIDFHKYQNIKKLKKRILGSNNKNDETKGGDDGS